MSDYADLVARLRVAECGFRTIAEVSHDRLLTNSDCQEHADLLRATIAALTAADGDEEYAAGLRAKLGGVPDGSPESLARWAEYHSACLWGSKSFPAQLKLIADSIYRLTAENAALRDEVEQVRKDAERYRWWRARYITMLTTNDPDHFEKATRVWKHFPRPSNNEQFDNITDAAIAAIAQERA